MDLAGPAAGGGTFTTELIDPVGAVDDTMDAVLEVGASTETVDAVIAVAEETVAATAVLAVIATGDAGFGADCVVQR
jgi:hypothetical protein